MEAKYNAQKHICQRLEIQVMELFSRLSAIEGEMAVGDHTRQSSMPRSIHVSYSVLIQFCPKDAVRRIYPFPIVP